MSWYPATTSTDPSRWTLTWAPTSSAANTYQFPSAIPSPRFRAPFAGPRDPVAMSPAFLLRRSQPISFAPRSYWARRTGLASFFFRTSRGSSPSLSDSSSTADSMPKAPCEWPGARSGAAGPAFV